MIILNLLRRSVDDNIWKVNLDDQKQPLDYLLV